MDQQPSNWATKLTNNEVQQQLQLTRIIEQEWESSYITGHISTKTVPTVYQQCTKNSQKIVKTAKMTIGVPIVTSLPRLYQQCTPGFKVTPFFNAEHLRNGTRHRHLVTHAKMSAT